MLRKKNIFAETKVEKCGVCGSFMETRRIIIVKELRSSEEDGSEFWVKDAMNTWFNINGASLIHFFFCIKTVLLLWLMLRYRFHRISRLGNATKSIRSSN